MADVASRQHPTNTTSFLPFFNTKFPLPQSRSWHLCQLNAKLINSVFTLLQTTPPPMALWHQPIKSNAAFGTFGSTTSKKIIRVTARSFQNSHSSNASTCFAASQCTSGQATTAAPSNQSAVNKSRWHYEPLPRPLYWTDNRIPWSDRKDDTIYPLPDN